MVENEAGSNTENIGNAGGKIGLYGQTPTIEYTTTGVTTGFSAESGTTVVSGSKFTGNNGSKAYTIGDIVAALKKIGVMAQN